MTEKKKRRESCYENRLSSLELIIQVRGSILGRLSPVNVLILLVLVQVESIWVSYHFGLRHVLFKPIEIGFQLGRVRLVSVRLFWVHVKLDRIVIGFGSV